MVGLLINKVLLKHVDLIVFQHAPFSNLTKRFDLSCKALIFIDFFHKSCILLRLSRVYGLRPPSLSMEHAFISCTDTDGVDLMHRQVGYIVEFNKVRIPQHIILILQMIFCWRVEGGGDRSSICKSWRSSELSPSSRVLVKFSHAIFIT